MGELERRPDLPPAIRAASNPLTPLAVGAGVFVLVALLVSATAGAVAGLIAAAVAFGAGRYVQRQLPPARGTRPMSPADELRAVHGDVRRLAPGDVVNYELVDWIVERTMSFDEGGAVWVEHMLTDTESGRKLWLSVEDDDGLEVSIYERVRNADLTPDSRTLVHDGVTYEREERGTATFATRDESGPVDSGTVEYADYSAGSRQLALERYGSASTWEVSVGKVISEHELDVYARGSR
jgi:hypothetical protein